MIIHKSFSDFVLFLYLHMAYADGEFHPAEKAVIISKMDKMYPGEEPQKILAAAEKEYLTVDKGKISSLILDTFRHYKDVKFAAKYHVYTNMYDIVHADGKVDATETIVLEELKKIIDLSAEAKTS